MDWDFLNIFKKAEFNTLVLSVSITCWILHIWIFTNIGILGGAILTSAYCIIRFIVFSYQYLSAKCEKKKYENQKEKDEKEKEKAQRDKTNVEISRMFMGLSEDKKKRLTYILLNGKRDEYNYNVLHFNRYNQDINILTIAQATTNIFRGEYDEGVPSIILKYYTDTIAVVIDPYLYDLINKYIEDKE